MTWTVSTHHEIVFLILIPLSLVGFDALYAVRHWCSGFLTAPLNLLIDVRNLIRICQQSDQKGSHHSHVWLVNLTGLSFSPPSSSSSSPSSSSSSSSSLSPRVMLGPSGGGEGCSRGDGGLCSFSPFSPPSLALSSLFSASLSRASISSIRLSSSSAWRFCFFFSFFFLFLEIFPTLGGRRDRVMGDI